MSSIKELIRNKHLGHALALYVHQENLDKHDTLEPIKNIQNIVHSVKKAILFHQIIFESVFSKFLDNLTRDQYRRMEFVWFSRLVE